MTRNSSAVLMLALALLALAAPARAESINIAAVVGEDVVTTTDLNERRDLVMAMNNLSSSIDNQKKLTPRILQSLINETLEMQDAKRLSITVSDSEVAKAVADLEESRQLPAGGIRSFVASHNLSMRSLEAQLRANVAWVKVVQRKLRRNVTVSEDEVSRAQQAAAAAPGVSEIRLAALTLPVRKPEEEAKTGALAAKIAEELKTNPSMGEVAFAHEKEGIEAAPPRWLREDGLPPPLLQALANLKPGDILPPSRNPSGFQILQLLERRVTKPLPDSTEVAVKDIHIPPPTSPKKEAMEAVRQQTLELRAHPGSCTETALGVPNTNAEARFLRAKLGTMDETLRSILTNLHVGDVSDPLVTPKGIELVMLCERIEPATTGLPDAEPIRQKLFQEKLELEAEKHLRDLRRDAYIDIKGEGNKEPAGDDGKQQAQ